MFNGLQYVFRAGVRWVDMMLKKHIRVPQAFTDEAVLMVPEQGYSVADVAKSLGVGTSLL